MNKRTKAKASSDGEDPGGILAAFMMNKRIKIEDSSDGEDTGDIVHVPDVEDSMPVDTKLEEPRARSTSRIGIRAKTTAPVASNGDSATRSDEEYMATSSDEEDMATSSDEEDTKPRQRTNPGSGSIHATSRRTGLRNSRTVQPAPMPSNQVRSAARPTKSRTKAARSTSSEFSPVTQLSIPNQKPQVPTNLVQKEQSISADAGTSRKSGAFDSAI